VVGHSVFGEDGIVSRKHGIDSVTMSQGIKEKERNTEESIPNLGSHFQAKVVEDSSYNREY
jgi:hypothetical protein